MNDHPLHELRRLLAVLRENALGIDTNTLLKHTGLPTLHKIRRWIKACNIALAEERWTFTDAVRERGTGSRRRWQTGQHLTEVDAACQRSILADDARRPGWVRTQSRSEATGHKHIIQVRALQLHDRILACAGGLQELESRLDQLTYAPIAPTRQGEVHISEIFPNYDTDNPLELDRDIPIGTGMNGLRTRGRGNSLASLPAADDWTTPLTAYVAIGVWMERYVACDDPADALARVAAEPPDWSEWTPVAELPVHRHVESVMTMDGITRQPPPSLRYRATLFVRIECPDGPTILSGSRVRHHAEITLQEILDSAGYHRTQISWIGHLDDEAEPLRLDRSLDPPPTPSPGPRPRAVHDAETNELRLGGAPYTELDEWADGCRERGDLGAAMALLRRIVATMPASLSTLEDLANCHGSLGQRDESLGLTRELIARAEATLPDGLKWRETHLPWDWGENQPFLRALYSLALDHERRGAHKEALAGYRELLRVCPSDNLGVRYCVLQLLLNGRDWPGVRHLLRDLDADEQRPAVDFAQALLAWGDGEPHAFQTAVDRHPLVASRIVQGDRAATLYSMAGESLGSFAEAERYWEDYRLTWTRNSATELRQAVQAARQQSPRTRMIAGFGIVFGDPATASRHMAGYRRALMNFPNIDPRHRDEFWDLTWRYENGSEPAKLTDANGALQIEWYGLVCTLIGDWQAAVRESDDAEATPLTMHFETLGERYQNARRASG